MQKQSPVIIINGESLTLERADAIAYGTAIKLPSSIKQRIDASHNFVRQIAKEKTPVYGINTGFGAFANTNISPNQLRKLQINILRSHASGYGPPLSIPETRLMMALRLNVLVQGYTGVSYELCQALHRLIQADIYPIVPEYGSVGASGDLIPLAHLALPLIGEGLVNFRQAIMPAADALKIAGIKPIILKEKEGLSLINGTQGMLAIGGLALIKARRLYLYADKITALTYEAQKASISPLHPFIHEIRHQTGQINSARQILEELEGSPLLTTEQHSQIQYPYSLRCAPQIHGASRDAIDYSCGIIEKELNAVTDNPLVFCEIEKILSGGNFHGQPLALAFDFAAMAVSNLANVSDRRLEVLLNPHMSGLPAFLTKHGGINSGYMATQYLSASLVNENKILSNPACTDSIPGNGGIEDFVSMGMTSARKLKTIVDHAKVVLAIELMAAAQAIDLQSFKHLGEGTGKTYRTIRAAVPMLTQDRILSHDIEKAVAALDHL